MTSPIGRLELVSDGTHITSLTVESSGSLPYEHLDEHPNAVLERASKQLERYFAGSRRAFALPLETGGTPFQRAIWKGLRALRFGETISYGALGAAAGRSGSGRAVGAAVRANPLPILIPCHRVLSSAGSIQGYSHGEGIATKALLLAHEGVALL